MWVVAGKKWFVECFLTIYLDAARKYKSLYVCFGSLLSQIQSRINIGGAKRGKRIIRRVVHQVDPGRQMKNCITSLKSRFPIGVGCDVPNFILSIKFLPPNRSDDRCPPMPQLRTKSATNEPICTSDQFF